MDKKNFKDAIKNKIRKILYKLAGIVLARSGFIRELRFWSRIDKGKNLHLTNKDVLATKIRISAHVLDKDTHFKKSVYKAMETQTAGLLKKWEKREYEDDTTIKWAKEKFMEHNKNAHR